MADLQARADALRELLAKATPGEWRVGRRDGAPGNHIVDMGEPPEAPFVAFHRGYPTSPAMNGWAHYGVAHTDGDIRERDASVALIVALHNAAPSLLDELDRLRTALAASEARYEKQFETAGKAIRDHIQMGLMLEASEAKTGKLAAEIERLTSDGYADAALIHSQGQRIDKLEAKAVKLREALVSTPIPGVREPMSSFCQRSDEWLVTIYRQALKDTDHD